MGRIEIEGARFPFVVVRYPPSPTTEDILKFYADWDELLARGPHGVIIDLRAGNPAVFNSALRRLAAENVERRRAAFQASLLVEARVVSTALMRGVVTAFDWIVGSSFSRPLGNFDHWDEAERFVLGHLAPSVATGTPRPR
jgi:hypothetical protein